MKTLSEEDEKRLRLFQERVNDLMECGIAKITKVQLSVNVSFGHKDRPNGANFQGFDRDHFRSAMSTLRQFMLEKDEVHFYKILKLISRKCGRDDLRADADKARDRWKRTLAAKPLTFTVGKKTFDTKEAMDLMWYGFLAHTHKDRAGEWEKLSPSGQATIYFIVQRAILPLLECLESIDQIIGTWLSELKSEPTKTADAKSED